MQEMTGGLGADADAFTLHAADGELHWTFTRLSPATAAAQVLALSRMFLAMPAKTQLMSGAAPDDDIQTPRSAAGCRHDASPTAASFLMRESTSGSTGSCPCWASLPPPQPSPCRRPGRAAAPVTRPAAHCRLQTQDSMCQVAAVFITSMVMPWCKQGTRTSCWE